MTSWSEAKKRLHAQNPDLEREYNKLAPRFAAISSLISARNSANVSQSELARRMHVTPGAISRLESGQHSPRLDTLADYARALGYRFEIKLSSPTRERRASRGKRSASGPTR